MFMDRKTQYCQISVVPNFIYRFNTTPVKTLASYLVDIDRPLLKLIWRDKRPRITNTILKEKNKVQGQIVLQFKMCIKLQ